MNDGVVTLIVVICFCSIIIIFSIITGITVKNLLKGGNKDVEIYLNDRHKKININISISELINIFDVNDTYCFILEPKNTDKKGKRLYIQQQNIIIPLKNILNKNLKDVLRRYLNNISKISLIKQPTIKLIVDEKPIEVNQNKTLQNIIDENNLVYYRSTLSIGDENDLNNSEENLYVYSKDNKLLDKFKLKDILNISIDKLLHQKFKEDLILKTDAVLMFNDIITYEPK